MSEEQDTREWKNFTTVERAMARRMQLAADVPIATEHVLVDVDAALALVKDVRPELPDLTFTTLLVAAVARGLAAYPDIAAVVDLDKMRRHIPADPGIGVAVDSPRGLVVVVVRDAIGKKLADLTTSVKAVVDRGRAGDRDPELYRGGHFSISNIAVGGVHGGQPIPNVPQIAILGVGSARETPVVRGGEIVVGRVAQFTMALDHRALDGMTAAAFLTHVAALIVNPHELLD